MSASTVQVLPSFLSPPYPMCYESGCLLPEMAKSRLCNPKKMVSSWLGNIRGGGKLWTLPFFWLASSELHHYLPNITLLTGHYIQDTLDWVLTLHSMLFVPVLNSRLQLLLLLLWNSLQGDVEAFLHDALGYLLSTP